MTATDGLHALQRLFKRFKIPRTPRALSCHPYLVFAASMLCMVMSGTQYAFSAYAPALKSRLGYEQIQISTIVTAANLGTYMGIVPSIIYDSMGPRTACALASILISVGYLGAHLVVVDVLPNHYLLLAFFFFVMGHGSAASYTASLATNVKNFHEKHRGSITGVLVAFFGLSAAIFSLTFRHIFNGNVERFFILMSTCGFCIPLVGVLFMTYKWVPEVEHVKQDLLTEGGNEEDEGKYLLGSDQEKHGLEPAMYASINSESVNSLNTEENEDGEYNARVDLVDEVSSKNSDHTPVVTTANEFPSEEDIQQEMDKMVLIHNDSTPIRMFFSLDFVLMIMGSVWAFGSGLLVINNLGSIMISNGAKDGDQNIPVTILSLCNCAGRIIFGVLTDRFRRHLSRPTWVGIASLLVALTMLTLAFFPFGAPLYAAVMVLGTAYGGITSILPSFIGDRFGKTFLGMNLSVAMIGPIFGSFAISSWLASFFYQRSAPEGSKQCIGLICWQPTFLICAVLCVVGFCACLLLAYRSRSMYIKRSERYADYDEFKRAHM